MTAGLRRYTKDERISVTRVDDTSEWILQIQNIQLSDAGRYECQVCNNVTAKNKIQCGLNRFFAMCVIIYLIKRL